MAKYVLTVQHRRIQVTASKEACRTLSSRLHRLEDIANRSIVKTVYADGHESTMERMVIYGQGDTPPREPEEFERKRQELYDAMTAAMNRQQVAEFIERADQLFDEHVAHQVIDHRVKQPVAI